MSFKVVGTNHTSFTVSNLERTLGLFRDGLGFEVTSKAPRDPKLSSQITGVPGAALLIAFVRAPGHMIELIEYTAPAEKGRVVSRPSTMSRMNPSSSSTSPHHSRMCGALSHVRSSG